MNTAFKKAWYFLKALPEQQIYQREPQLRNTRSHLGGDRSATVHPAIEGMLRRKFGEVNLDLAHNTAGQKNPLHESPVGVLPEFTRTQKPAIGSMQDEIDNFMPQDADEETTRNFTNDFLNRKNR